MGKMQAGGGLGNVLKIVMRTRRKVLIILGERKKCVLVRVGWLVGWLVIVFVYLLRLCCFFPLESFLKIEVFCLKIYSCRNYPGCVMRTRLCVLFVCPRHTHTGDVSSSSSSK